MYIPSHEDEELSKTVHTSILLSIYSGLLLTVVGILGARTILEWMQCPDDVLGLATTYLRIYFAGQTATMLYNFGAALLRAGGDTQRPLYFLLAAGVVNVVLNLFFVLKLQMDVAGVALATVISQSIGLIWIVSHYLNKNTTIRFKPGIFKLKSRIIMSIFSIGMSPFLMNVCASSVVIILNNSFMRYGGDLAIGAYGIVNRVLTLFIMIEIGVTQGMQPVIGFNYGALLFDRVRKTLRYALIAGVSIMTFGFLLSQLFPSAIVGMFTDNHELMELSKFGLRVTCLMFPLAGCQIIITNFFQSIGKAKVSIFLSLSRQLLFLIPFLLILPRFWGITGVWSSMPMADFISFMTTIGTFMYFVRKGLLFKTNKIVE